jgi:hypothetical protein
MKPTSDDGQGSQYLPHLKPAPGPVEEAVFRMTISTYRSIGNEERSRLGLKLLL